MAIGGRITTLLCFMNFPIELEHIGFLSPEISCILVVYRPPQFFITFLERALYISLLGKIIIYLIYISYPIKHNT